MNCGRGYLLGTIVLGVAATANPVASQTRYDLGASDAQIKIGNIMPYSGPASAYALIGKTEAAYFKKVNSEGGINGRRIKFISYDDAYNPSRPSSRRAGSWKEIVCF